MATGPDVTLIENELRNQDAVEERASWEGQHFSVEGLKNLSDHGLHGRVVAGRGGTNEVL